MSSTAILVVDVIGSKELASQPGGHVAIHNLCQEMRDFLDTELQQLNDGTLEITLLNPQGDDIEYRLRAASLQNVADTSLSAVIAAFSSGPSGKRFRYVVYSSADINYQPRIRAFSDISKTEEGKKYHIAMERSLTSALGNQEIVTWLKGVTGSTLSLDLVGEPWPVVYVDLYCRVSENRHSDKRRLNGAPELLEPLAPTMYPPGGVVPVDSTSYVRRSTDDETLKVLRGTPFTMLVSGPVQCGKSSLLAGLERKAREAGVETFWFDHRVTIPTPNITEREPDINAGAALAFSEAIQAEWGLEPQHDRIIASIPQLVNWLMRALDSTTSKRRLIILDDLANLGARAAEDWLSLFVRVINNKRATRGFQISIAVGITNHFGTQFSRKLQYISSIVNWWPRIDLGWFVPAEVALLERLIPNAASKPDAIFDVFAGQPYLTHAALIDVSFLETVRRWIDDRSTSNSLRLRRSLFYRRHLNAIRRSVLGPTLESDPEIRGLLDAFMSACDGKSPQDRDQELFLKTSRLLSESGTPALSIYNLISNDLIDSVGR
jgi:hypothetical protein